MSDNATVSSGASCHGAAASAADASLAVITFLSRDHPRHCNAFMRHYVRHGGDHISLSIPILVYMTR